MSLMSAIFQKDFNVIMGGGALLCCCHGPTKLSPQDVEYLQQNTRYSNTFTEAMYVHIVILR